LSRSASSGFQLLKPLPDAVTERDYEGHARLKIGASFVHLFREKVQFPMERIALFNGEAGGLNR